MAAGAPSFKLFLIVLFVAAFVVVAAHQHRYDYFRTGQTGKQLSIKEYYVDPASTKQEQQLVKSQEAGIPAEPKASEPVESTETELVFEEDSADEARAVEDNDDKSGLLDQIIP